MFLYSPPALRSFASENILAGRWNRETWNEKRKEKPTMKLTKRRGWRRKKRRRRKRRRRRKKKKDKEKVKKKKKKEKDQCCFFVIIQKRTTNIVHIVCWVPCEEKTDWFALRLFIRRDCWLKLGGALSFVLVSDSCAIHGVDINELIMSLMRCIFSILMRYWCDKSILRVWHESGPWSLGVQDANISGQ